MFNVLMIILFDFVCFPYLFYSFSMLKYDLKSKFIKYNASKENS